MENVYVLTVGEYPDEYSILGVFATEELAKAYVKEYYKTKEGSYLSDTENITRYEVVKNKNFYKEVALKEEVLVKYGDK